MKLSNPLTQAPAWLRTRMAGDMQPRRLATLATQEGGIAAVEFALILPILLILWIGGVEVTGALSVDRRLNNLASSIGDLVAREKSLIHSKVADIFDIAPGAMFPYEAGGVSMRVSAVNMDDGGEAEVAWSRACRMGAGKTPDCGAAQGSYVAHTAGTNVNAMIPANLRVPSSQIIMSEVFYTYKPAVGYVVTGDLALEDRLFFVPRLVAAIELCETAATPKDQCQS